MDIKTTVIFRYLATAIGQGYRILSFQGSSRSGKTYNILIFLITYCLQHPGIGLSIVRSTLPSLKGSALRDFKDILISMGLWDDKAFNKSDLIYTFQNGSWVEFFSCDNEAKLRGRKRDILFVNEANELKPLEWQQLNMRTTLVSIIDYNPSFSDDHWICAVNKDPSTYHIVTTYKQNPFLPQRIINEIESLREKNSSLWQIYGLGQQAVVEGLVFKNVEVIDYMPGFIEREYTGMDFGFTNDPTAIIDVAVDGTTIYIDEICYRTHMLTNEIIGELKPLPKGRKIIAESADPRLIQEIRRAGLNIHAVHKHKGSIEAGVSKMQEYRLAVTRRSSNVIKELKNYVYEQDSEGNWLNQPIDAWNHAIDAVRYVILEQVLGANARKPNLEEMENIAY